MLIGELEAEAADEPAAPASSQSMRTRRGGDSVLGCDCRSSGGCPPIERTSDG